MKRIYSQPTMTVVNLLPMKLLCESVKGFNANIDLDYGGASNENSGDPRVKESNGLWDEEW